VLRVEATDAELTEIGGTVEGKYTEVKPVGNEDFVNSCRMSLNV
jgi:hypothetical protein